MTSVAKSAAAMAVVAVVAANYLANHKSKPFSLAHLTGGASHASQAAAPPPSGATAVLRQGRNGHYFARVEARGASVNMVVDTGASFVTLTADDARKLGYFPSPADYRVRMMTANGESRAARVKLGMVRIDGVLVYDVDAVVAQPGALNVSLLGMTFLRKLASYRAEAGRLVLHQ